ncbi:MAG: 6-phosphofructokinase [Crocinitomicaceae bacterium]
MLGTTRSKEFRSAEGWKKEIRSLEESNIDGFICIGGDGAFTGASILLDGDRLHLTSISESVRTESIADVELLKYI